MTTKPQTCPKCGSINIKRYDDLCFIKCNNCGHDDLAPESFPYDVKKSQKAKGKYSPYKTGGKGRTRKK